MNRFECLVTVFKWIKHEKEEKKTKIENAGKFRRALHPILYQTSISHNFFFQTPIHAFLDSTERSLSLESNHMIFNGNLFSDIC